MRTITLRGICSSIARRAVVLTAGPVGLFRVRWYEFRALGDGVCGIKIKGAVGKRHRNELSTHQHRVDRVHLERSPRRDDFVPRIDVGQENCWMSPTDPHPTVT